MCVSVCLSVCMFGGGLEWVRVCLNVFVYILFDHFYDDNLPDNCWLGVSMSRECCFYNKVH